MKNKLPDHSKDIIFTDRDIYNASHITNELKPCPFCGGIKILTVATKNQNSGYVGYKVWCASSLNPFDCNASMNLCLGAEDTMEECRKQIVEKWNRRV